MLLHRRHSDSDHDHSHAHNQGTRGRLLDRGWRYDLEVWFLDTFVVGGEISRLRHRVLDLADLTAGEKTLDVGCGTGTLAIQAAHRLAGSGQVTGVDPAPRQIARARSKARRAGVHVDFRSGVIEDLSFPDGSFDAVVSTLMLHHLPGDLASRGLAEIARVLKPRGRLVLADFDHADDQTTTGPASRGYGGTRALPGLLRQEGFCEVNREHITFGRSHRGWSGAGLISARKP